MKSRIRIDKGICPGIETVEVVPKKRRLRGKQACPVAFAIAASSASSEVKGLSRDRTGRQQDRVGRQQDQDRSGRQQGRFGQQQDRSTRNREQDLRRMRNRGDAEANRQDFQSEGRDEVLRYREERVGFLYTICSYKSFKKFM